LKALLSILVTAMGFFLGAVLAGVGGLSAKTFYSRASNVEGTKKIETYWQETGLKFGDISKLVSNDKCYSSEKYFQACLNSVIENALIYRLKITTDTAKLVKLSKSDRLDEMSEKQLLDFYTSKITYIDFNATLNEIMSAELVEKRAILTARVVNSFLSIYYDPHTYILPEHFYDEVSGRLARSKFFVGLSYEKINGDFYIKKISKNSDAELAGLKIHDKIISIDSEPLKDKIYSEVSSLIKNENADELKFRIERKNQLLHITLRRSYRELSHVQFNIINESKKYAIITLSKFNSGVCAEVSLKLDKANKEKVSGLILDLRDNPGGQMGEASCIAGLFLGKNKKAYYVEYFDEKKSNEVVLTSDEKVYYGPMVVLVNSFSASASELLAGGLQDYKRALIVGERTYGKGTFQEPQEWALKSHVSLFKTQGIYLLPSRNSTQLSGITPDVVLNLEQDARREELSYFRPVQAKPSKNYKLLNSEIEKEFSYSFCKVDHVRTYDEDSYIYQGLKYLDCVQKIDVNIAETELKNSTVQ
jgi:carboxyl-terminal processing protease